jgi:hypothetical protein
MNSAARITKKPKLLALAPAVSPLPVHRFSVDDYHEMIERGIITENDRVELIHGWIVAKMGINPPHNYSVNKLMKAFLGIAGSEAVVRVQQPITMPDSEPEPDIVFATGTDSDYEDVNPTPEQIHVIVEVSDTSLRDDQTTKLELYASEKVAIYWVVNLVDKRIEVYTNPRGGKKPTYKTRADYDVDSHVPVVVAGKTIGSIAVKDLLP